LRDIEGLNCIKPETAVPKKNARTAGGTVWKERPKSNAGGTSQKVGIGEVLSGKKKGKQHVRVEGKSMQTKLE